MKFSIIIVAYKAQDKLIKCLESLARNPPESGRTSRADAEIILIDNSPEPIERHISNDLLVKLLQTYTQVITEWHPENPGFAAACNLGVSKSSGDLVVLANPDTEVFPEWSERMIAHLNDGIGAIGPISNFVAGFQNMHFHMKPAKDWATQAKHAARGCHRRAMDTKLLIGFFLMVRRKVWDEVGGMDPQFFLGCDDLDLSLRIREAGYKMVIATDVFVYHDGHASFKESDQSLILNKQSEKKMMAKIQAKYGENIPTSTELWGCEILPTYTPKRQTLSVLIITRDDDDNLKSLLPQLRPFAEEVIIVDTKPDRGYTMKPEFIEEWADYVSPGLIGDVHAYLFPWTDSFAEARNFALSKCTGDWVLWLDADDRVTPESAALIRAAMDNPGPRTQAKTVHFGFTLRDHGPDGLNYAVGQPRLFPRVPGLEWEGRVHESYMDAAARLGIEKVDCDIIIDHTGYQDPDLMLKKHARNLRLMRMEEDSPKKFYHMGKNLQALGHFNESEDCYRKCLETTWAEPLETVFRDQVRTCMASLIISTKGPDKAVDAYLEDNAKPDALFLRAEVALARQDIPKAVSLYEEYAAIQDANDPHGSNYELFQRTARGRLDLIAKVREEVDARG